MTGSCGRVLVGKVSQNSRDAPLGLPEHLPQNQSLFYCFMTFTNSSDSHGGGAIPDHLFSEGINLELQLISLLGIIGVFQSKPLRGLSNLPERFTRTPTAMHSLQSPNPERHGKLKIFKQYRASQRVRNCQNQQKISLLSQCLLPSFHIPCIVSLKVY